MRKSTKMRMVAVTMMVSGTSMLAAAFLPAQAEVVGSCDSNNSPVRSLRATEAVDASLRYLQSETTWRCERMASKTLDSVPVEK